MNEHRNMILAIVLSLLVLVGWSFVAERWFPTAHPQTWEPPIVSPRIAAQRAQFLYSPVVSESTGSLALGKDNKYLLVIHVSPQLKKECVKTLSEVYDIRYATLFPDIDGFGYAHSFRFSRTGQFCW